MVLDRLGFVWCDGLGGGFRCMVSVGDFDVIGFVRGFLLCTLGVCYLVCSFDVVDSKWWVFSDELWCDGFWCGL